MKRLLLVFLLACGQSQATPANVCEEANAVFQSCGASAPFLTGGTCNGFRMVASKCVVNHAKSCDELGTLFSRLDSCMEDDAGDPLTPPDDVELPIDLDGGT